MMFTSSTGVLARMREKPKALRSIETKRPCAMSSATARPAPGDCWTPWPEKPLIR